MLLLDEKCQDPNHLKVVFLFSRYTPTLWKNKKSLYILMVSISTMV